MKILKITIVFIIGIGVGVGLASFAPDFFSPYVTRPVNEKSDVLEGIVKEKLAKEDKLLFTVVSPQGALLATFKKNVSEINLLVEKGDTITLRLRQYEPFIQDPKITRVTKGEHLEKEKKEDSTEPTVSTPPVAPETDIASPGTNPELPITQSNEMDEMNIER